MMAAVERLPPRRVVTESARVWPVAAVAVWAVLLRAPAVAGTLFRWGWVPVGAVMAWQTARRHLPVSSLRRLGWLSAWWAWAALTLLWSPDPAAGGWLLAGVGMLWLAALWAVGTRPVPSRAVFWAATVGLVGSGVAGLAVPHPPPVAHLNPNRILAMTAVGLVVVGWSGTRGRAEAAMLAVLGLAITVGSGSRMASVALLVLLVVSPALRLPRRGRLLLTATVAVAVILAAGTAAFQQRWFVGGDGSLVGLVTGETRLDTSGRAEVWPQIAAACTNPWFGDGAGAASRYGREVNPGFPEPHNEYLRVWCDTGLVGVVLLAGFVASVVVSTLRARSRAAMVPAVAVFALLLLGVTDNPLTTLGVVVPSGLAFGAGGGPPPTAPPASMSDPCQIR